ncbi:MAG: hypothetical protein R3B06_01815 [Kofleriaceae bacterium]
MRRLHGILVALGVAACGPRPPHSTPAPPGNAGSVDQEVPSMAPAEALAALVRGDTLPSPCFAWSASAATLACATEHRSIQGGGERAIRFIGGAGEDVIYYRQDGYGLELDPAGFDQAALDGLRARFTRDDFTAWHGAPIGVAPNAGAAVTAVPLRWRRTFIERREEFGDAYQDVFETDCGAGWVAQPGLAELGFDTSTPTVAALVAPSGQLIMTSTVAWGAEGDAGWVTEALPIDRLCPPTPTR